MLIGLGGLIAGVSVPLVIVGVIGFVVMLGGVILAVAPTRGGASSASAPARERKPKSSSSSFMDRMNDRWDRRQGER